MSFLLPSVFHTLTGSAFVAVNLYHSISKSRRMFKTKLNHYCQTNTLNIPHYQVTKEGPDHRPRFTAVVVVDGVSFRSGISRSIKEAENLAAELALQLFSGHSNLRPKPASTSIRRQDTQGTSSFGANHLTEYSNIPKEMRHLYKSQLQIYAQKRNLELPVYSVESVGPCHEIRFKCRVIFEGKCCETKELFHTAKEAEYAAAKVALDSITPEETKKEDPFIYKNLLQEILQKERSRLPKYTTVRTGLPHIPTFMSTVEVKGESFRGHEEHTKKQAELNAAKVAYVALKERRSKKYDKLVGATTHVMETPIYSSAVLGACNSSKTVRTDARPMLDIRNKCEGKGLKATPNPFTRLPIATRTTDSGSIQNLKATSSECYSKSQSYANCEGEGPKATTTRIPGSIQNLKATSSVPEPISYPKTPSSTVMNSQLVGPTISDRMKMKRKMLVFPESGKSSPEDVEPVFHNQKELKLSEAGPVMRETTSILAQLPSPEPCECALHSNKKWIALIPKEET